jgi:hypothetical protein
MREISIAAETKWKQGERTDIKNLKGHKLLRRVEETNPFRPGMFPITPL